MKKQYRDPELKLVLFNDVIITSGGPEPVTPEDIEPTPDPDPEPTF